MANKRKGRDDDISGQTEDGDLASTGTEGVDKRMKPSDDSESLDSYASMNSRNTCGPSVLSRALHNTIG